jgi:hypothetical protein
MFEGYSELFAVFLETFIPPEAAADLPACITSPTQKVHPSPQILADLFDEYLV